LVCSTILPNLAKRIARLNVVTKHLAVAENQPSVKFTAPPGRVQNQRLATAQVKRLREAVRQQSPEVEAVRFFRNPVRVDRLRSQAFVNPVLVD
jgi:hypothetical protein